MISSDENFVKEFRQMCTQRSGSISNFSLGSIRLARSFVDKATVENHDKVYISGIYDEYYTKLNSTEAVMLSRPSLSRRLFGSDGNFLYNNDGSVKRKEVPLPKDCIAVLSDIPIGVSLKFQPKETLDYVDYIEKELKDGKKVRKYIYIVPKKFCYKLNQVALILSSNKMRVYYEGLEFYLQNGKKVFLYTIPYKPHSSERSYRVLQTKTSIDFSSEIKTLLDCWEGNNIIFDRKQTELDSIVCGVSNVAFNKLDIGLQEYTRFNPNKPLSKENEEIDDILV